LEHLHDPPAERAGEAIVGDQVVKAGVGLDRSRVVVPRLR
jgi:hypothetical protein